MIIDTSAIVLKTIEFSESSLIVSLLSEKHGKIPVMARGARRNKNKFGGLLQPGAILDVTYYYKSTRDIQNLSDATQKWPTWQNHRQIEKMAIALATLELCEQLCHEYEPMPELSVFLTNLLVWLHETNSNPGHLFPYIQFRLTQIAGIGITWQIDKEQEESAVRENEEVTQFSCYLNVENGCVSDKPDHGLSLGLTKSQGEYLRYIAEGKKTRLLTVSFPAPEIRKLIHHLDTYFLFHLDSLKARKSDSIFEQIL